MEVPDEGARDSRSRSPQREFEGQVRGCFMDPAFLPLCFVTWAGQCPSVSMFPPRISRLTLEPHSWIMILILPLCSCETWLTQCLSLKATLRSALTGEGGREVPIPEACVQHRVVPWGICCSWGVGRTVPFPSDSLRPTHRRHGVAPSADPEAETGNHRGCKGGTPFSPVSRGKGSTGPGLGNPSLPREGQECG